MAVMELVRTANATTTIKTWKDVKQTIIELNPFIGKEIDSIVGVDEFPVIVAQYPFGASIVNQGKFQLQIDGQTMALSDPDVPQEYRDLLDYYWQVMPFGMLVQNSVETFTQLPNHITPYRLYTPGRTFSLLSIFEQEDNSYILPEAYSTVSGCRSLITLPQIAHKQYHRRVNKRFLLEGEYAPKNFSEQWEFFSALANSPKFNHPWQCEIVFFSRHFQAAFDDNPVLKCKLLQSIWQRTAFERNQTSHNLVWSSFIEEHVSLATKNSLPVMETARYLIRILMGVSPGYVPATDDIAGPVKGFTKALLDVYRIRFYLPVFMRLKAYDMQTPIYYSLQKPCFAHAMPEKYSHNQTIKAMQQTCKTMEQFKQYVLEDKLPFTLRNTLLYQRLQDTEFEYFHPRAEGGLNKDIGELFNADPRFGQIEQSLKPYSHLTLPDYSMFLHGCIRMKPKS